MNKTQRFVVDTSFIKAALERNLSLNEFLLLLFFDNAYDSVLDINLICKTLNLSEEVVLETYSNLISKGIIKIETEKNESGKLIEKIQLDSFYQNIIKEEKKKEQTKQKEDIFSIFESQFGRTLSGMDYEIINAWISNGYSEELITAALNEAVYNGVTNLRYIDKILYEWNKKGIKSAKDINNKEDDDVTLYETKILNFNWLDE